MSNTKKIIIIFSSILFVSLVAMGITLGMLVGKAGNIRDIKNIFAGSGFSVDESRQLSLDGIDAVEIDCTSADVHIVQSNNARAELKGAVIPARKQEYLSIHEQGGTLFIKVRSDTFFSVYTDLDLTVYLPEGGMLDARVSCTSGDVDISNISFGELKVLRTSGDLKIKNCTAGAFETDASSGDTWIESSALGSMRLTCRSGEISTSETSGTIYARTTSGDINISGVIEAADIGCTSGDVSIDITGGAVPPITANLTSGDVRIYMPESAAFDLSAKTTSGRISSNIDITVSGSSVQTFVGEQLMGKCNGGGASVSVSVTSGDISIIGR